VTPERAGEILGVSRQTIYTWQDEGRLSKIMQGSKRMAPLAEVLEEKEHAAAGKRLLEQTLKRRPESQNAKSLAAEALRSGERWASELARLQDGLRKLAEQAGVNIGQDLRFSDKTP